MSTEDHPAKATSKTTKTVASNLASLNTEARWQDKAACKGMDPIIFFGPDVAETVKEKHDREEEGKKVCVTCPVKKDCLDYSLESREPYGIWGGLTETERKTLIRRRAG